MSPIRRYRFGRVLPATPDQLIGDWLARTASEGALQRPLRDGRLRV